MLGGIFFRKNCSQAAASRTLNICIIALVIVLAVFFLPQSASAQTTTQPRNSTALQVIQFPIKAGEAATAEISNLVSSTLKAGIDGYLSIGEAIWPDVPAPASVSIPSSSRTATSDRAGDRPADNQNNQNSQRAVAGTTTSDGNKASNATRLAQNLEPSSGNDQQTSRPVSEQTDNVSSVTDSLLVSVLDNLTSVVSNLTRQLDNQDRVARTNTTQSAASGNSGIVTQDQLTDTRNQLREIMSKNDESILDAASDDDGPNIDSTDDVSEGSNNLYYTNKRVDTRTNELLDGGTNITLNYNRASSSLRINAATSSGQANTAANIGTGTGIFAQKSGIDLQFKSLTSGSNVTLATSSNEITIGSTQASPAGSDGAIQFNNSSAFGADGANLFWDAANNRLGVGTTSPNTKLTVAGAATVTGTTTTSRLDIGSKASIYSEDDVLNIIESGNPTRYNFGERPIFQAAGQNVFSIRGSGIIPQNNSAALGQGYAPWKKLYLTQSIRDGNSNELLEMNANDSAVNYLSIANSASGGSPTLTATGTDNSVDLKLKPKATDANGKVVVESEADSEPLFEVNNPNFSGGNGTLGVRIYDGGGSSILQEGTSLNIETLDSYPLSFSTNGSSRMQIDSSGNVGIGTTSPSSKLAVDGDINLTDGNAYQYAGNDFAYASTTQSATALGIGAEADNTKVTAIGKNAASGNSGTYVTAIGNGAAENNTEPNLVVVGGSAGKGNEGDNLVAVGIGAGFSNSGNRAVGVGKGSVRGNSGQAALGFGGGAVRGNSGDYAIGIGEGALKNNTYNSSIGLGKNASTTGANQLVIGSDTSANGEITEARIGANTQDSYPLIYANQSTGAGLGTTSPSNQLTVDGDANITDNLGVGTKNPAQNLDVVGTARIGNSN
jgi:hypothetical protein